MNLSSRSLLTEVRVQQTFGMIVHSGMVDLGSRVQRSLDDRLEAIRGAIVAPSEETDCVIGVQVATDVVRRLCALATVADWTAQIQTRSAGSDAVRASDPAR